jgi:signal transduction histidine kinase
MTLAAEPLPRLLSLAVHELRTPVTVVAGYLRMLLREQGGPISDKQRKMLEEAERSCSRLGALVEEMSELGKLESGTAPLAQHEVDIAALLRELASGMHEGEDRGVRLELRGTDRPLVVTGDRTRLAAALNSLMHAALRERGEPGVIVAQCSTVTNAGRTYAQVAFAEESLLAALTTNGTDSLGFDEYRGGTGLRLPLARRVIEGHGGALWSAATNQELEALDADRLRSEQDRLPDPQRREFSRKRATAALRLPLQT